MFYDSCKWADMRNHYTLGDMPSIRKTKKRLKREIVNEELYLSLGGIFLADAAYQSIKLKKQELENLKRKKK